MFPLKGKSIHPFCVIYEGTCSCGETYIGETIRNAPIRWKEHNDPTQKSEPAKYFFKKKLSCIYLGKLMQGSPKLQSQG